MSATAPRQSGALLEAVDRFIQRHDLLAAGERVLVGLSGGVDSVVLVHVLRRLGFDPQAAHVNYGLRGGESDADEAFVRRWCAAFDPPVPLEVVSKDAKAQAEAHDQSLQEAARVLRYRYFAEQAEAHQITRVAVGHHRDDQAETLLLNLFRGSGLEGLAGMPPARPMNADASIELIRPMLDLRRAEIEAYAEANDLAWRTDASNRNRSYRRNRIRHDLLPAIEDVFEGATDNIAAAASRVRAYLSSTQDLRVSDRFSRVAKPTESGGILSLDLLADDPTVWRHRLILEALRRWCPEAPQRASVAESIDALLDAQVGRRVELSGGRIWRERDHLRFVADPDAGASMPPRPVPWGTDVDLPAGTLRADRLPEVPADLDAGTPNVVYADADALGTSMHVRPWQSGDRFQPLGMQGTKRVSDYLTDAKVPPHQRARVLVLCSGDRVAWVVGHRLSHAVRVRPETTTAARLAYRPPESDPD
jgi:tRNA(Ile)-lysidine synthase